MTDLAECPNLLATPSALGMTNRPPVPQQRYNIDGSLRQETPDEVAERERRGFGLGSGRGRRTRAQRPTGSHDDLLRAARESISIPAVDTAKGVEDCISDGQPSTLLESWGPDADRALFGRGGEAPFRRGSPQYDEFQEFFAKFAAMRAQKLHGDRSSAGRKGQSHLNRDPEAALADARHALVLFCEFQRKKQAQLREKIEKDRASLPIKALEGQIINTLATNRVVLIAADTGAGKSTQVPQYLVAAGYKRIAVTQPRRIACMSLARRVSYEGMNSNETEVAYQVRFDGNKTPNTKILFLTEGLLLRQYMEDARLSSYEVIIVDEVHERHMSGDFLLGVLKRLLAFRPDVRIVLMSATINADLFSRYFNAPVIEVPGRMFPVSIEYLPVEEPDRNLVDDRLYSERLRAEVRQSIPTRGQRLNPAPYLRILERIDQQVPAHERGDMLIFLSGFNEIAILGEELKKYASHNRRWIILALHSSLSVEDQEKVFDIPPPGVRKCILSTNIAETSVTIDGVRFIIDSGAVKEMAFDSATKISRLSEFWISKSSAKQRAGRAGRTGPGQCFRLYSKLEYTRFSEFPVPEILRQPLEPLILQVRAYSLGDPRQFDFIERPATGALDHAIQRLQVLSALDAYEELTPMGSVLAKMPLDVVLGKMLVMGSIMNVVESTVIIAAALSVQSPFLRVPENQRGVLENRRKLYSEHGDPFTLHNVFTEWLRVKTGRGEPSSKWCRRHGLEEQRLYEMMKLKSQFDGILRDVLGIRVGASSPRTTKRGREIEEGRDGRCHPSKRKLDWTSPEYQRRQEQRRLLQRQKLMLNHGKRRVLSMESQEDQPFDDADAGDDSVADVTEMSIDALEFALKHGAQSLATVKDVGSLIARDINILKLVICSGLYPNQAIPDDANQARDPRDQVFHTHTKRFLAMHPTSVFAETPELVHPCVAPVAAPATEDPPTLESLRPRSYVTETLCYVELLETTKPYLVNVLRVPALGSCLLFAEAIDIAHDCRNIVVDGWLLLSFLDPEAAQLLLVLANFLRVAWQRNVSGKLPQHASHSQSSDGVDTFVDEPPVLLGTKIEAPSAATDASVPAPKITQRRSDWHDLDFIPLPLQRVRAEWEEGTFLGGIGCFAGLEPEDVSGTCASLPFAAQIKSKVTTD
ncbi:DEAH (Asp-Glu-Ala-His) box polypeptide 34 [Geranomyces variabilis]|nr:DEAH (Asp-Glu-Ala-His) box polypeptide 34 [Geranomyces variabilis]